MDIFERENIKEKIKEVMKGEDTIIEQAKASATILRHYYNALRDKGFTAGEAIHLVAEHGIMMGCKPNEMEE